MYKAIQPRAWVSNYRPLVSDTGGKAALGWYDALIHVILPVTGTNMTCFMALTSITHTWNYNREGASDKKWMDLNWSVVVFHLGEWRHTHKHTHTPPLRLCGYKTCFFTCPLTDTEDVLAHTKTHTDTFLFLHTSTRYQRRKERERSATWW